MILTMRSKFRALALRRMRGLQLALPLAMLLLSGAPLAAQSLSNKDEPPTVASPLPALPADALPPAFVLMHTNFGDVLLELDAARAPVTVRNFLAYTKSGFYDGTAFHRIMRNGPTAIVQGGGYASDGTLKATEPPITNEWANGLKNVRGTISMARLPDANSATSQFFFNLMDQPLYDVADPRGSGYCVFGKVVAGLPVLDAISLEKTGSRKVSPAANGAQGTMSQWPVRPCIIEKLELIPSSDAASVTIRVKNTQVKDPDAKPAPIAAPTLAPSAPNTPLKAAP